MTIRVLTEETINKIAAGEVIENPASVVKELIENSIDAGSANISIEIQGGGFGLIKIVDDGCGMGKDDALLCFERHATSKIGGIDDLWELKSMGFRGEALSSIGAVARVELITAQKEGEAFQVEMEGGKVRRTAPAARRQGTTFEIRSLFYNTPARKKFQKQPGPSTAEIHKLVTALALAHPEIGFELRSNGEVELQVKKEPLLERIHHLFGESFLAKKIEVKNEEQGYVLSGYIGGSSEHRINRTGQYLFVNRRAIQSSHVSFAVKEGFGERLPSDRYPVFVLHLSSPPHLVDVNVHPQKKEVRFQEKEFVHAFVKKSVQAAFGSIARITPSIVLEERWEAPMRFREEVTPAPSLLQEEAHVIGLFEHYLLLDASTVEGYAPGIVWVDLQKVHQNIICRALKEKTVQSQGLLLPIVMEVTTFPDLSRYGFVCHKSGKTTLMIEAIPSFLEEGDAIEAIRLVLDEADDPFLTLAHFAVQRKKRFVLQEALTLWKKKISEEGISWTGLDVIKKLFKTN